MPSTRTNIASVFTILMLSSGIAGVLIRNILVYTVGAITPGYSSTSQLINELSANGAPYEVLINTGSLMVFGGSLIIASKALQLQLPGREAALSIALMAISGVCFIGMGLFPCPPALEPEPEIAHMVIHSLCDFMAPLSLTLSALVYGFGYLKGRTTRLRGLALILAVVGLLALFSIWIATVSAAYDIPTTMYSWKGAIQRLNMATGDLWVLLACAFCLIKSPPPRAPEFFLHEQDSHPIDLS